MKTNKRALEFCFKGDRQYIQGADLFNTVFQSFGYLENNEEYDQVELTIHKVATQNMDVWIGSEQSKEMKPNAVFLLHRRDGKESTKLYLYENDSPIDCRKPYPEHEITNPAVFNEVDQSITLKEPNQFSLIENIVALNKELLNRIHPDITGKWYFTRLKVSLEGFNLMSVQGDIKVVFRKNFHNKITDSIIYTNGIEKGNIYFSLV